MKITMKMNLLRGKGGYMELSFCDLRAKEVVNIPDGRKLGNIIDMVFDTCTGKVTGIVVPSERSFFSFFKSNRDIFIPYCRICKIGKDIILVDINPAKLNARISEVSPKNKETTKSNDVYSTNNRSYYSVDDESYVEPRTVSRESKEQPRSQAPQNPTSFDAPQTTPYESQYASPQSQYASREAQYQNYYATPYYDERDNR